MKKYIVKAGDHIMEWNSETYEFEAETKEEAEKIAEDWFNTVYLPETLNDPQSYSDYPEDEEDYENEEDYERAVEEAQNELAAELDWWFLNEDYEDEPLMTHSVKFSDPFVEKILSDNIKEVDGIKL